MTGLASHPKRVDLGDGVLAGVRPRLHTACSPPVLQIDAFVSASAQLWQLSFSERPKGLKENAEQPRRAPEDRDPLRVGVRGEEQRACVARLLRLVVGAGSESRSASLKL